MIHRRVRYIVALLVTLQVRHASRVTRHASHVTRHPQIGYWTFHLRLETTAKSDVKYDGYRQVTSDE